MTGTRPLKRKHDDNSNNNNINNNDNNDNWAQRLRPRRSVNYCGVNCRIAVARDVNPHPSEPPRNPTASSPYEDEQFEHIISLDVSGLLISV